MNKLTKAAIAGGVGIALLLGGAGTLATWNSSSNISGGTIVSGKLVVGTPAAGSWTVAHLVSGSTTAYSTPVSTTLASYAAAPGDKLIYTTTVPITAVGTNLVATLGLTPGAIAGTTSAVPATQATNNAFASFLGANTIVAMTGTGITGTAPAYSISGAAGTTTATVTATITFASGAAGAENTAMLGSVDLSGMAVSLTQNS
ncbi:alternate-type signal peptide domain-containing protein [Lacisediminihabitans sp.]|uniref:alternate-type signal peptide domain-containing protein n=1 Tax=Lacisediminihabitans sp. TaxID=2787631 RepID=UPI00374DB45E